MKTIKPYYGVSPMSSSSGPKGSSANPYTQDEFDQMVEAGTWEGGYVEGMGYCMGQVTVTASYPDSSSSGSDDSWPSEDSEDKNDHNPPVPPITGGGGGGSSHGGGGTGSGNIGGGNGGGKPLSPKEKALNKIDAFSKSGEVSKFFTNLSKDKFVESLKLHINNPIKINQGTNGTCGAAAICKYLAEFLPEQYVEAAISLYTTGKYDGWELELPDSSKSGTIEQVQKINTTIADVLMQGAIINSFNYYLDYDPFVDGSGARSFMWPQCMDSFFEKIGKPGSFYWWTDVKDIQSIDFSQKNVIAGVEIKIINDDRNECRFVRESLTPNHYVQITGYKNDSVYFWQYKEEYLSKNCDAYFIYVTPK